MNRPEESKGSTQGVAHTPGPWRVDSAGWDGDGYARYSLAGVTQVCAADARLIAAAPTMREFIAKRAAVGDAEASQILEAIDAHS